MQKKTVYVGLAADILHKGHMNILKLASKYGDVTVGLLTDKAISSYKNLPHLNFDQRKEVLKNIRYVKKVIAQDTLDYTKNLNKIKPHFVVHGDDWKKGVQKKTRSNVLKTLKKWSGKLIEPRYTKNISSSEIKKKIKELGTTPDIRRLKLKRLLNSKKIVRVLECHNPISGLIIENLSVKKSHKTDEFHCMWSSSLTDSVSRGMPDNQSVDYSVRTQGVNDIFNVTTKPLIFDIDNGGSILHLPYVVKKLESIGVSAIIMEDKIGEKSNSLFKDQSKAKQDTIKNFCKKIRKVKDTAITNDFLCISRIESLILGKSMEDAIKRAKAYSKAGTDLIMIHSKEKNAKEIFHFAKKFRNLNIPVPLVAAPSTYSKTRENELAKNGFKIVIYDSHLFRASYNSMLKTAKGILENERSFETEKNISSIENILHLI